METRICVYARWVRIYLTYTPDEWRSTWHWHLRYIHGIYARWVEAFLVFCQMSGDIPGICAWWVEVFLLAYGDEWTRCTWHMEGSGLALISGDCCHHLFFLSSMLLVESSAIVVDIDANTFIRLDSNPVYNVHVCRIADETCILWMTDKTIYVNGLAPQQWCCSLVKCG